MKDKLLYLDSSALAKLAWLEDESASLHKMLNSWPDRISSELAHVEVIRAAHRVSTDPAVLGRAREVVAATNLLAVDEEVLELAATVEPHGLRSLDAIHLASALSLGSDLGAMVTYDSRLASAARQAGIKVLSPGT